MASLPDGYHVLVSEDDLAKMKTQAAQGGSPVSKGSSQAMDAILSRLEAQTKLLEKLEKSRVSEDLGIENKAILEKVLLELKKASKRDIKVSKQEIKDLERMAKASSLSGDDDLGSSKAKSRSTKGRTAPVNFGISDSPDFSKMSKGIKNSINPASVVVGLLGKMDSKFQDNIKTSLDLADVLYGHSLFPDMAEHLDKVIGLMSQLQGQFIQIKDISKGVHTDSISLPEVSKKDSLSNINGDEIGSKIAMGIVNHIKDPSNDFMKELLNILGSSRSDVTLSADTDGSMPGGGEEQSYRGRGRTGLAEQVQEQQMLARLRDKFDHPVFSARGIIGGLTSVSAGRDVQNLMEIDKNINNITGSIANSVAEARDMRKQMTSALEAIRSESGFTIDQINEAGTALMQNGITSAKTFSTESNASLKAARALNTSVGSTAEYLSNTTKSLMLGSNSMVDLASGAIKVAKETGKTAESVFEIQRGLADSVSQLKDYGSVSASLVTQMTKTAVIADKLGVGQLTSELKDSFGDMDKFQSGYQNFGVLFGKITNELRQTYEPLSLITGSFLTARQGEVDFNKALAVSTQELKDQVSTYGTIEEQNFRISALTGQRIKSMEQLNRLNLSATEASETQTEKAERLLKLQDEYNKYKNAFGEPVANDILAKRTGNLKGQADLTGAINTAKSKSGDDIYLHAADVANKMESIASQMNPSNPVENMNKAFEQIKPMLTGNLSDQTSAKQILELAQKGNELNAKTLSEKSDLATDNIIDQTAKGVEKGLQKISEPIMNVIRDFEKMGIGPFIGSVAMFGTAVTSLIGGIFALQTIGETLGLGKTARGIAGAVSGSARSLGGVGAEVGGAAVSSGLSGTVASLGGATGAKAATKAGEAAATAIETGATAGVAATTSAGGAIGKLTNGAWALAKSTPKLLAAVGGIALVAGTVGILMQGLKHVFPPSSEVIELAKSMTISAGAFGIIGGALFLLDKAMLAIGVETSGLAATAAFTAVGLAGVLVAGVAIGGTMMLLQKAFGDAKGVLDTASAIATSSLALTVMAGATLLLGLAGTGISAAVTGTGGLALLTIPIALGVIAATGYGMALTIEQLQSAFKNVKDIGNVTKSIALASLAIGAMSLAVTALTAAGTAISVVTVGTLGLGLAAIPIALKTISFTGSQMASTMEDLKKSFGSDKGYGDVAMGILASGLALATMGVAIGVLSVAGTTMALLTVGTFGLALTTIPAALNVISETGMQMASVMKNLQNAFAGADGYWEVAKSIAYSTLALSALSVAAIGLSGIGLIITGTLGLPFLTIPVALYALSKFGASMGEAIGKLQKDFPDAKVVKDTSDSIIGSSKAMKSLASAYSIFQKVSGGFTDGIKSAIGLNTDTQNTIESLTETASTMGKQMQVLKASFPDPDGIQNTAKAIEATSKALASIPSMVEKLTGSLPKDGIFSEEQEKNISDAFGATITFGMLIQDQTVAMSNAYPDDMGKKMENVSKNVNSALDAFGSIQKSMNLVSDIQSKFGEKDSKVTFADMNKALARMNAFVRLGGNAMTLMNASLANTNPKKLDGDLTGFRDSIYTIYLSFKAIAKLQNAFGQEKAEDKLKDLKNLFWKSAGLITENKDAISALGIATSGIPKDMGDKTLILKDTVTGIFGTMSAINQIQKDAGGSVPLVKALRSAGDMLSAIPKYFTTESMKGISDAFTGIDPTIGQKSKTMLDTMKVLPDLIDQVESMSKRFSVARLSKVAEILNSLAMALAPLKNVAEALSFKAPEFTDVQRNLTSLQSSIAQASTQSDTIAGVSDATVIGIKKATGSAKTVTGPVVPNTVEHNYDHVGHGVETADDAPYGPEAYSSGSSSGSGESDLATLLEEILTTNKQSNVFLQKITDSLMTPSMPLGRNPSGPIPFNWSNSGKSTAGSRMVDGWDDSPFSIGESKGYQGV